MTWGRNHREATVRGGYGTSDHGSLADRSGWVEPAGTPPNPARHCFVDGSPALLVEWRQGPEGWEGRVVSMAWLEGAWVGIERWLPATRIASRQSRA